MLTYFYERFFNDKEKQIFHKKIENTSFALSPSTRSDTRKYDYASYLFKENKRAGENIEKCKNCMSNKSQIKVLNEALIDLFTQSKFMLKQIHKLNNDIDDKNKIFIEEMVTNISQLNNIFDSIYERTKKRC